MARKRSDQLKRKVAQSYNALDKAMFYLLEAQTIFKPIHPQYAELIDVILQNTLVSQQAVKSLATTAWGYFPSKPQNWIN